HRSGFDVELAGLRQERLLLEIVDWEEGRGAFAGCGRNDWRIGQSEAAVVEEIAGRFDDFGTDTQDCRLPLRAHPEMAVLHQEIGAMLFWRDGIRIGFRNSLYDLDVLHVEFVSAGSALVGADFAFDNDAGFLR